MKLILKTFLLFIVLETINSTIMSYSNKGIAFVASIFVYVLQCILLLKIYLKTNVKNKINITSTQIKRMLFLSFIIFMCYNISEVGFTSFFISNYVQNYPIMLITIINAVIIGPFSEEVIFRGILLNQINKRYSFLIANIIQAFIFALFHFDIYAFAFHFLFGIVMGIVCKYMNIYCCVLIHSLNNISSLLTIFFRIKVEIPKITFLVTGLLFSAVLVGIMLKLYKSENISKSTENLSKE